MAAHRPMLVNREPVYARDVEHDHEVARARFGLGTLERVLDAALTDLGVSP